MTSKTRKTMKKCNETKKDFSLKKYLKINKSVAKLTKKDK